MFNVKDKHLRGHQVDYLNKENQFMSPEYLDTIMSRVEPTFKELNEGEPVPKERYDSSFKTGNIEWKRKQLEPHDVFSLGVTLLYAGNLRPANDIYNHETYEIDEGILNFYIKEFEDRYDEKTIDPKNPKRKIMKKEGDKEIEVEEDNYLDSPMVANIKRMLAIPAYNRPSFASLKNDIAPELSVREKSQIAWGAEKDPFKDQEDWRAQQLEEEQNRMTQKELEALALRRLAEDPIHGGVFGKHNEFLGKRDYGHQGHGLTGLSQGKLLGSLDYLNERNKGLVRDSHNFHPDAYNALEYGDVNTGNFGRSQPDGIINRRYIT